MSALMGVYFFFAVFCAVPDDNGGWQPLTTQQLMALDAPAACYEGTDPGFPPPWSGLPGEEPETYDI